MCIVKLDSAPGGNECVLKIIQCQKASQQMLKGGVTYYEYS